MKSYQATVVALLSVMLAPAGAVPLDKGAKCQAAKHRAIGRYWACREAAAAVALTKGRPVDLTGCDKAFDRSWGKIEVKGSGQCPTHGDATAIGARINACATTLADALEPGTSTTTTTTTRTTTTLSACGNGVVESGETCDPLASCPSSCPSVGCQLRSLEHGGTCQAACVDGGLQSECVGGDGCCPSGCNANDDADCASTCGNGVVESGETCDPLASCPSSCPSVGCQLRSLQNGGTCQAACVDAGVLTACVDGDGCCPSGCNANDDADCASTCGNGVVEPGETCDPPGSCPACNEAYACYVSTGSAATCDLRCHLPVTTCSSGDDCCAFDGNGGCDSRVDAECSGTGWAYVRFPQVINLANGCTTIGVYGIHSGGHYVFTTCVPPGTDPGTGDSSITRVMDTKGQVYNATNDDCTDPTALPLMAGWSCQNSAGAARMSCAPASPGGFPVTDPTVSRLDVTVCPFNATPGAGAVPFFVWWNASAAPNPG